LKKEEDKHDSDLRGRMSNKFDPAGFLNRVARRLVIEFDDAGQAGSPGLIGAAKEHPVRKSLECLLPGSAALGSGLIIDSHGAVSRQQDIVVYERDFCPVFSVNSTSEATYYPCEGVIAVGEVKSALGTSELQDAFAKIASAKGLRRHAVGEDHGIYPDKTVSFRLYGSPLAAAASKAEEFDHDKKAKDQIYGFILCGRFELKVETLIDKTTELWRQHPRGVSPNLIVSLQDGFLQPFKQARSQLVLSALDGDAVAFSSEASQGMACLVALLNAFARTGRTVAVEHFRRYFLPERAKYQIGAIRTL
jgi:hypothetical protein